MMKAHEVKRDLRMVFLEAEDKYIDANNFNDPALLKYAE